jgi:hypothetical protein
MPFLHHYTDLAGLTGIATSGALWATNFLYVNDEGLRTCHSSPDLRMPSRNRSISSGVW